MTSQINSDLLSDTLNVVQLARQAAMARGSQDRAGKLSSVANELHKVVSEAGQTRAETAAEKTAAGTINPPAGNVAFHSLLASIQSDRSQVETISDAPVSKTPASVSPAMLERNLLVTAMASGTMSEVDIARQLGITRDEVRAIMSLNKANAPQKYSPDGGES